MLCDNLREVGWGRLKEAQEGGDICVPKAMGPHSSSLAWKLPWTEEPGRPQSMES